MNHFLVISSANELLRIQSNSIVYIQSDGNYSNILLSGGDMRLVTMQLGQIEKLISQQLHEESQSFARIGKSLIIHINLIFSINISHQQLVLQDRLGNKYSLTASREALRLLKETIEKGVNL